MYRKMKLKGLEISYLPELDGGGGVFGQQVIKAVADRIGKVEHAYEFCAGPGFIGFSLLAHGLCERLTLADINPVAVRACETTIRENGLGSRVSLYQSDCLDGIPDTERWDFVVRNGSSSTTGSSSKSTRASLGNISILETSGYTF